MTKEKKDRIKDFYQSFKKKNGFYPTQTAISLGIGISRQAVSKYFKKNETALKKISEYRRYFVDNVNQAR